MSRNKNCCSVTIKQDRKCYHCKEVIPKGTKCLTVNPRGSCRVWFCNTCEELSREISRLKVEQALVPFGDEGGALALLDELREVEGEYEGRRCE